MYFASENYDGATPEMIEAIANANNHFQPSYGKDAYTDRTRILFEQYITNKEFELYYCFNGTGANNFALSCITEKYRSIYCADVSHLYMAEGTAPEAMTGCRLYPVATIQGKIILPELERYLADRNLVHQPMPGAVSITQPTEYGTVYSKEEIKAIVGICRKYNLKLHIDGARLFNALSAKDWSLDEFIRFSEADAITVGGTKAGLVFGEAVLLFGKTGTAANRVLHKRSMQLASKNRYIAAQFEVLLNKEYWKRNASYTNGLALYFALKMNKLHPGRILYPVETNMVFLKMDVATCQALNQAYRFYRWNEALEETRFCFSFSNTRAEIDSFFEAYQQVIE